MSASIINGGCGILGTVFWGQFTQFKQETCYGQTGDVEELEAPQCVYLCGVQPLPVKALTTFVIGDLKYQIGQIKPRDLR
ncbi:MAG TPA: hypothetical protein DCR95_08810 [Desulfobacter sp.]|uniref:hypothetical protein n=1 Tax=Desulfobacter sp. UBA2225 TaxID=1961413 RepID=UPI000E939D56|nr:hypothetical protein [Desulfobacter sp. UBA2225]HAR34170.1 hypothetical protein [Desulfobacter sp.]